LFQGHGSVRLTAQFALSGDQLVESGPKFLLFGLQWHGLIAILAVCRLDFAKLRPHVGEFLLDPSCGARGLIP
jgi:hypothetical protein